MAWQLVNPSDTFKWPIKGSLQHSMKVEYTVFGDENGLFTSVEGSLEIPWDTKYIWQGGHENTTEEESVRDLWLHFGYQVTETGPFPDDTAFPALELGTSAGTDLLSPDRPDPDGLRFPSAGFFPATG